MDVIYQSKEDSSHHLQHKTNQVRFSAKQAVTCQLQITQSHTKRKHSLGYAKMKLTLDLIQLINS